MYHGCASGGLLDFQARIDFSHWQSIISRDFPSPGGTYVFLKSSHFAVPRVTTTTIEPGTAPGLNVVGLGFASSKLPANAGKQMSI